MDIAFTSDTHYGHANIIKYCNRPFANVDEMNTALATNINKVLPQGGILYHLGDWSMGGKTTPFAFRTMLNNNIKVYLIEGNHDESNIKNKEFLKLFEGVYPFLEKKINGQRITLCHYALRVWNKSHHGSWHLYGHSHGTLPDDPNSRSFDVGVDCHNFRPLTFEEVRDIILRKNYIPIDHHGKEDESVGKVT
jgi:calcineurin-like phosphoesterase family protein